MKSYKVTITETLKKEVEVEARSAEEALQKVRDGYRTEDYVLYPDDFDDVKFRIEYPKRDRDYAR